MLYLLASLMTTVVTCLDVKMHRTGKVNIVTIDEKEYYNYEHGEYTTTIYLGSPPQAIENVVLDTGSYMPWVKV